MTVSGDTFVFVYGTLRAAGSNHGLLSGNNAERLHDATTPARLYLPRGGGIPFATTGAGTLQGELYRVDAKTLADLDRLEGHPHNYKREIVPCTTKTTPSAVVMAWCYFIPRDHRMGRFLSEGDYRPSGDFIAERADDVRAWEAARAAETEEWR